MHNDDTLGITAIGVFLGGLILLCLIGTISWALVSTTPEQPAAADTEIPVPQGEALARIYFEVNSSQLPAEAGGAIQSVKEQAEASPKLFVLISGYHDPTGDPEQNAALAKQRAQAAQAALIAAGVPEARILLRKPEVIPGNEDLQEARRVDLRVQ